MAPALLSVCVCYVSCLSNKYSFTCSLSVCHCLSLSLVFVHVSATVLSVFYPLPLGSTFPASTITGPLQTTLNNIELDQILFFAPAGAIVPMAPVVQYSDALPGGPLQVCYVTLMLCAWQQWS